LSTVVYLTEAPATPIAEPDGDPVMSMAGLSVSIRSVRLVETGGKRIEVAAGARLDRVSAVSSSTPLAAGDFPPGSYEAVELVLADATVRGIPAAGGSATDRTVSLPGAGVVRAAFAAPVTLSAACDLAIDWPAIVSANEGATVLTLGASAQAFVLGDQGPSCKPSLDVRRLKGDLGSLDGAKEEISVVVGRATVVVGKAAGTSFVDQDGRPVADGLEGLDVGDQLQVSGVLGQGRRITADVVRVMHRSRSGHVVQSHHGGAHFEFSGVARNVAPAGTTGATFRIFAGKVEVARVTCEVAPGAGRAGTALQLEDGTALSLADFLSVVEGRRVQITASLVVQEPGGTPEALRTNIVIVEP